MSNEKQVDPARRGLLVATCTAGGAVGLGTAGVLVSTFQPSERAKAAGAPVEVDLTGMQPGDKKTVEWRGKPVWILKRSPEMLAAVQKVNPDELADPNSERAPEELTPEYARNPNRAYKEHPDVFVAVGICSHLGCSPSDRLASGPQPNLPNDWPGGFLCPCHGSTFDLSGRVFKNKPAPDNLQVPRYMFVGDNKLIIGKDEKGEA
jgi:ubiquinol-cytochrome c reductase iron-sulfur subunit